MQVAASPFSSPYHSYYQFQPSGTHDHELKRQYLSLLPPKQIIEICLTFDPYVPPHAKTTIWPLDLNAAIAELQKIAPSSLSATDNVKPSETQGPPTYPFGYGHHQAAYPHAPYYASAYPYPYSYPPNGLQPSPLAPSPFPPYSTPYGGVLATQPPEASGNDDLPSYEEMIVEALSECTDPDGCVPKDLFTWMATRYPLQSNFRPSASQALQKAYKRGRFEKSANGKYRISPSWEGGSTSRRTTRRPQTHGASSSSTNRTNAPPFTHAPLVHQHHPPHMMPPVHPPSQQPYPVTPYGHPGYPGYIHQPPPASASNAPGTEPASSTEGLSTTTAMGDSAAAYEAAQSILKAINFGGLLQLPPEEDDPKKEGALHDVGNGVEHLLSHVQAVLASRNSEETASSLPSLVSDATLSVLPSSSVLRPDGNRPELQAHLALLSAQLAELVQIEESQVASNQAVFVSALPGPAMDSLTPDEPSSLPQPLTSVRENDSRISMTPAPAHASTSRPSEVEDSDDDMEAVI